MAATIHPLVLAAGTVREVAKKEFVNRETAEIEQQGRKVTLLTRSGFLQFNAPLQFGSVEFEIGAPAVVRLESRSWSFNGRDGHTYVLHSVVDPELVEIIAASEIG